MQTLHRLPCGRMFINDASKDKAVEMPRELAAADERVKVIVATRDAGHVRFRADALLHPACGDAPPTEFETAHNLRLQGAAETA
jgi:hypothetical protein